MAEGEEEGGGARMKPNELRKVVVGVCVMEKKVGKTDAETEMGWVGMGWERRGIWCVCEGGLGSCCDSYSVAV